MLGQDAQSTRMFANLSKKLIKSVRAGGDGLRPTMGLEGGPGAWWRTRMLPSPFTVLLSVDKLEAAAGQPAVWQGAGDIPPARRGPNHFYTSSVPLITRDSHRCSQPARQLSEKEEAGLLSEPDLQSGCSYPSSYSASPCSWH